ncbi:hypothetical protein Ae201684P_003173 [Aphanomyces euteiches]|uniref:Uncharacterized protein n=1 Tax=Aphanomyces euteiches TaxID=100861 RepID=A0A6G0X2L5_9STRA|nr:hypothetical protein Ae201684_009013 [Aphanomyces euteiches]KAH9073670.1 hypothetical protein Ae201684P_003173 [Aphanomyces euteiches]
MSSKAPTLVPHGSIGVATFESITLWAWRSSHCHRVMPSIMLVPIPGRVQNERLKMNGLVVLSQIHGRVFHDVNWAQLRERRARERFVPAPSVGTCWTYMELKCLNQCETVVQRRDGASETMSFEQDAETPAVIYRFFAERVGGILSSLTFLQYDVSFCRLQVVLSASHPWQEAATTQ